MPPIREGDRIRIEWGDDGAELSAKVLQLSGSWVVLRPEPNESGDMLTPNSAEPLNVFVEGGDGSSCPAGLWRTRSETDAIFQLQSDILAEQRRAYFRSPIQLSLALSERSGPAPRNWSEHQGPDYQILTLEDLSGGGCRCRIESTEEIREGDERKGYLNLDDGQSPLELDMTVVRIEPGGVAFCFSVIREKERQRILQTLFREYREKRAAAQTPPGGPQAEVPR